MSKFIACPKCFQHNFEIIRSAGGWYRLSENDRRYLLISFFATWYRRDHVTEKWYCPIHQFHFDESDISTDEIRQYYYGKWRRNNKKLQQMRSNTGINSDRKERREKLS